MKLENAFLNAIKDEKKGKKHKGLLRVSPNQKTAESYLEKAKKNLQLCNLFLEKGFEYKLPEEWFYTLYYCGLAILSKFGIESRSQRCTAAFLRYTKDKEIIDYDDEFIDIITVYSSKEEKSDVDERESARYGASIKSKEVSSKYDYMDNICKKAISQCEEIIFSEKESTFPDLSLK
jgi:uncharacterized protein (UPF0332 family)